MNARSATLAILAAIAFSTGTLSAQDTGAQPQTATPPPSPTGLQIRSVSAYAVYDSSFLPNGSTGFGAGAANLPADGGGGGSIVMEWTKLTERTNVTLDYTPSYTAYVRNSNLNALNHALSFTASRKLAPRWSFSFSAAGNLSSMEQSLFSPTTLSTAASVPSTFNDLSTGLLSGKFANNPQLGNVLAGSSLVESPLKTLLYGRRMFTASTNASFSYSYSPRFSVNFGGGATRSQQVSQDQTPSSTPALVPDTTSVDANLGVSYSLSPFTQIGATAVSTRITSQILDSYNTTTQATWGRTVGMHWVLQAHGGVGFVKALHQTVTALKPSKPGPATGGSLTYKTLSHTFLGSYDRTVLDAYGLGASTTSTASVGWHWRYPSSSWWLDSSFNWQQLQGGLLTNTSGWHVSVGLSRMIGTQVVLTTQYVHLKYSGGLQAAAYQLSQDAIRVSVGWTPHPTALR